MWFVFSDREANLCIEAVELLLPDKVLVVLLSVLGVDRVELWESGTFHDGNCFGGLFKGDLFCVIAGFGGGILP